MLFLEAKNQMNHFLFLHSYEKNICKPTVLTYKISNPIVNDIIFQDQIVPSM